MYAKHATPQIGYPYEAVLYMKKNGVPNHLFNNYNWGGYLIWMFPGKRFFIDGRMDNFFVEGKPFIKQYWEIVTLKSGWEEKLTDYKINAVLGPPDEWPLIEVLALKNEWSVAFKDEKSILLVRN